MSGRLGAALAEHIRTMPVAGAKYVLVEGVPISLAEGMARAWREDMPPLAVVSGEPGRFGPHALVGTSATALRNSRGADGAEGVVLVLCEGEQVPDRQSLALFEPLLPSTLLDDAAGVARIAQQQPPVALDGAARAVREAINRARPAARPSAAAVATYLDRLAAGDDPLAALPALGAFSDSGGADRTDGDRIGDNLALAARRTSEGVLHAYPDLRARAQTVLSRRPGLRARPQEVAATVDNVMRALQQGDDELLTLLQYDEAREILEKRTLNLADTVHRALGDYRDNLSSGSQAAALPWDRYQRRALDLRRGDEQRPAAQELLDLDSAQKQAVFTPDTRRKLELLLRDRSISGSNPSAPEAALIRAVLQLGGAPARVEVIGPQPPGPNLASNRSSAGRIITLACARMRLGALMRRWEDEKGCEVDGLLLHHDDQVDVLGAFADADLASSNSLPPLQLRLRSNAGTAVQVDWKPDLDDAALLRAAHLFAEAPCLTLAMATEPTLHAFNGTANAAAAGEAVPEPLLRLAGRLQRLAQRLIEEGAAPSPLDSWAKAWASSVSAAQQAGDLSLAVPLALVGAVSGGNRSAALTPLSPPKAEWLGQYLAAMWQLLDQAERGDADAQQAAAAVSRVTAAQHPAFINLPTHDRPCVPTSEGRMWSLYGGRGARDESGYAAEALRNVLKRLLTLQPEAAGHLRCLAWGAGAADALAELAVDVIGKRVGGAVVGKVEIFCIGQRPEDRPNWQTLAEADDELRGSRDVLELRYLDTLEEAERLLGTVGGAPSVHLALVTGITEGGTRLNISNQEVRPPADAREVLFAPRTWQRPKQAGRTLLMPPTSTEVGRAWLTVQNAVEEDWPEQGDLLRVPEARTGTIEIAPQLKQVHDLALWVATLDRYATRDSLEAALGGSDNVAILHQERRLGGDSPLALVLSQKSGGPADRAIGRSLRAARIVSERDVAFEIGTEIRKVASQGYGILALEAATSGAGINELVGHCVAFALLATQATPWPLPPGCRVLLVSLDEYQHWFRTSKRADLLAIALDPDEGGVHVAAIEVKARRSDETEAASGALDQLFQTLSATRWAAYPDSDSVQSRLWLNRIAEAAYSVARESRFKLDAGEIAALEAFRQGDGSLEWAGVGLIFGPNVEEFHRHYPKDVAGDIVPVVMHGIKLTEALLRQATTVELTTLRTVEADAPPLQGGRVKRRPEAKAASDLAGDTGETRSAPTTDSQPEAPAAQPAEEAGEGLDGGATVTEGEPEPTSTSSEPSGASHGPDRAAAADSVATPASPLAIGEFHSPILGWDLATGEEVRWHPAGPGQTVLQNGHTEIWGSSGMGKTQFVMALLGQLAHHSGSRFGIADFKNDYSDQTGFPQLTGAQFLDLWNEGAPYNPLALEDRTPRAIDTQIIELRDTIVEATSSFTRMGVRQKSKLEGFLRDAYSVVLNEGRWPTLRTLDGLLDSDLAGVLGDLTRHELFRDGPPLGEVIDHNVVFGLSRIPGNGQTTVLAAGFILSSLLLRVQNLPPVPNTIRYVAVVDEAHRVAAFRAVTTMVREGRSKGLAVLLATQQPLDLPEVVAANAQTKLCFGLPDATVATMAARKLDPGNSRLADQIRSLGSGEAFLTLPGAAPRLLRTVQAYRDRRELGLP